MLSSIRSADTQVRELLGMVRVDAVVRKWTSFLWTLAPAISIWIPIVWYGSMGSIVKVDNLFREGIYFSGTLLVVALYMLRLSAPPKLRIVWFWCLCVCFFGGLGIAMGASVGAALRDTRDSLTIFISIFIGYHYVSYSSLRTTVFLLIPLVIVVVFLEWLYTPSLFWGMTGFLDYQVQVFRIAGLATSGGEFEGYYNASNIVAMFENYDSLSGKEVINHRYGGIFANPIVFGHFFSAATCLCFYDWKVNGRKLSGFLFLVALAIGGGLLRTKGYGVSVLLFLIYIAYHEWKRLRIPLVVMSFLGLTGYLALAIQHNLTALQHILVFQMYWDIFMSSPIVGIGVGNGLFDDTYLGRLLVHGGLILAGGFIVFGFRLWKTLSRSSDGVAKSAFVVACLVPLTFTTAGVAFLSIYLYGLILGVFLREEAIRPDQQGAPE